MTNLDENSKSSFKVVDKRRFSSEGELKAQGESEKSTETSEGVDKVVAEKTASEETPNDNNEVSSRPPITYSLFIQSLAQQTFMALGLLPWPDSGLVQVKLDMAKETIDVLDVVSAKTKGNLSEDEEKMQTSLLYELRVAYMQILQGNTGTCDPKTNS